MRFKLDENLPVDLAGLLRFIEHDVMTVYDQSMGGEPDSRLVEVCQDERRALITLDLDFSDVRTYPPEEYSGIVVLRLRKQDKASVLLTIQRLFDMLVNETLDGRLFIVEEDRVRIRGRE